MDEAVVQARVRLAASQAGARLWRNNVGAGVLSDGSYLRWGLANDSTALNKAVKSGDLIGIKPVLITAGHVGQTLGVFCSREVKRSGWRYNPNNARERAQQAWIDLVRDLGGDAAFTTGEW
jgi:hypothetical protein